MNNINIKIYTSIKSELNKFGLFNLNKIEEYVNLTVENENDFKLKKDVALILLLIY